MRWNASEKIKLILSNSCSWILFYILPQPKRSRLSHFPVSLPIFLMCCNCSHTFLLPERSERATKWLNTLKYSERSRRSVGVRRSTWRDWKAVGSRWFFLRRDNKKKIRRLSCAKKYKRIKCWCLVFKGKLSQSKNNSEWNFMLKNILEESWWSFKSNLNNPTVIEVIKI